MREQYAWVEWFNELSTKISTGGPDWLADKAPQVQWRTDDDTPRLLAYGLHNVDPFSFIYTLATNCNGRPSRTRVVQSVTEVFELDSSLPVELDNAFYFPQGLPLNTLFHGDGGEGNPTLLWDLFRDALGGIDDVRPDTFHDTLEIPNVGVAKLTQALFLIDGDAFIPYDGSTRPLLTGNVSAMPDWSRYRQAIEELRAAFPGARLCEINLFAYLRSCGDLPGQRAYRVSTTNVNNDGRDYWDEFDGNSCVFAGGRAPNTEFEDEVEAKARRYPLQEPDAGDLVLVRNGPDQGRAIGVVWLNEYRQSMTAQSRIQVIWLNKAEAPLGTGQRTGRGFERAIENEKTFRGCGAYEPTFAVLDRLSEIDGLNRAAVLAALQEFDEMGRDQFVERYGKGRDGKGYGSGSRWIVHEEENYDLKPIWRAAFGHMESRGALTLDDERYNLHSNKVQDHIEQLGFTVIKDSGTDTEDRETSDRPVMQPINQILYGPPGTGKTWRTVNLSLSIVNGHPHNGHDRERFDALAFDPKTGMGNIAMVTFHQNFTYEDFVEGIRPVLSDDAGGLHYELRDGLFKKIADEACKRREERFVLIIDEINRGNIARIFGELITLIEPSRRLRRDDATRVTLPYSNELFGVPDNLYLIGTMNTADRSIQLLDTALRRRFEFVEMMPKPDHQQMGQIEGLDLPRLLQSMNDRIAVLLDREHQIGHTYLLHLEDVETLGDRFRKQVFPLLQEYFFDDWSKIQAVLGRSPFVVSRSVDTDLENIEMTDEERTIFERLSDTDPHWTSVESYRAVYETNPSASSGT